jgi:hypothetical protein
MTLVRIALWPPRAVDDLKSSSLYPIDWRFPVRGMDRADRLTKALDQVSRSRYGSGSSRLLGQDLTSNPR